VNLVDERLTRSIEIVAKGYEILGTPAEASEDFPTGSFPSSAAMRAAFETTALTNA